MLTPFTNEPLTNFATPHAREAMQRALHDVGNVLGHTYPVNVGGTRVTTTATITSLNPSLKHQVVGVVGYADLALAERAMHAALDAFVWWQHVPWNIRARYLLRAAQIMRLRKLELAAWEVYEAGKPWVEADADVAEAIDFLEYYAREALVLGRADRLVARGGEQNEIQYLALGVGVIAAPFNFPLAILAGMTTAALVAGNTVVVKPSDRTPVIAMLFAEIMECAGLPAGVLSVVPGPNQQVGDYLVDHPRTRFINFTGSRAVGLRIVERAARPQVDQRWIKRIVAEMGGKDAIIVLDDADLDAAATGIVTSAFGFQGQKCSACSRAIILDSVYDALLVRVIERTRALPIGPAMQPDTIIGPLIDQRAYDTILSYIDVGKGEARLAAGGQPAPILCEQGYFIEPTVFADVDPTSRIAQEEIFGPVLAVIRARDLDQALEIANGTPYGLTGSIYAQDRSLIERARCEFHVGNLYINRPCTGALVGVHPFGGFDMSGTNAKAGGPDYLLQFVQAKVTSERL